MIKHASSDPMIKRFNQAKKSVMLSATRKEAIRNRLSRIMGAQEKLNGKLVERRAKKRSISLSSLVKRLRRAG
jgi:hypothetical protein